MAAVETAAASDTEFFLDNMTLSRSSGDGAFDRTDWHACTATVAFGVDVCLGSSLDGVDKTSGRTGVHRSDKIFPLREIIEPGEMVDDRDRS